MICVAIGRSRHKHMMAEHRHLAEEGAKMVELRLDYVAGRVSVGRLMANRPDDCQVIITCRRKEDGGKWNGSEEARQILLREAIAEGVDYVDLEEDIAADIPRFGTTKRIISYHNFRKTPEDLRSLHARMAKLDPDIVKIACTANDPHDNLRVLELMQESEVPTVAMCMGDIGTPSRILAPKFGAVFAYATFHHERALAPGQLSFRQMREVYRYDEINLETEVYGVIADPVGHSLSPQIHNAALQAKGINAVYCPFRVPSDSLDQFIKDAHRLGIRGLSVTIPHKEAIARHLNKIAHAVKSIAAVNTVVFDGAETVGYNTDYNAAMDCIEQALGTIGAEPSPVKNKRVLVLGAGGVARPIVYGLRNRGALVTVASRTRKRSDRLAETYDCKAVDWDSRQRVPCDIIINCTPIGMHPNVDETPISKSCLKPSMLVFDTVYNPESTLLIKDSRTQNCQTITGIEMFVRQGRLQFLLFTGQEVTADVMHDVLKRQLGQYATRESRYPPNCYRWAAEENMDPSTAIALIGYRGTGKTTVARLLAEQLDYRWIDADDEVERQAGKTIATIFSDSGEKVFRELESAVVAELCDQEKTVIAFGGGAVLRENNRKCIASCQATVWLTASAKVIQQRISADPTTGTRRPNLTNHGGRTEIEVLLEQRQPFYRSCATLEVDTEDRVPAEIAAEIVTYLSDTD